MYGKNHIIRHRNEKQAKKLNVPEANVIDLRTLKKEHSEPPVTSTAERLGGMLQKIQIPRLTWPAFLHPHPAKKEAQEKIIVSRTEKPLEKRAQRPSSPEATTEKVDWRRFHLARGWHRTLAAFAVVCLLLIVPVYFFSFYQQAAVAKGKVLGISSQGLQYLQAAGGAVAASDFAGAGQSFTKAAAQFRQAQAQLQQAGGVILDAAKLVPGQAKSAASLLAAGRQISQAGENMTTLIAGLENYAANPLDNSQSSLTDFLSFVKNNITPVQQDVTLAMHELDQVRPKDLPAEYQASMVSIQAAIPTLRSTLNSFSSLADVLLSVLGRDSSKRYLFIFQNNRELRPTGGFIGSIALMDIYKGQVQNLEVPGGGIYDLAGQLKEKIVAPKPLWLINPNWNIQDANWFPDYPTSAKKIIWFYERTGGATVDGIIALTPAVIEDLLAVTGPIDMQAAYGVTVDQHNFVQTAQQWAEVEYDRQENKPKKFIGDLLPILLGNVFQADTPNLLKVVGAFNSALENKDLLLYFSDADAEKQIQQLGWDGGVKNTDKDYLFVVDTNIGGGKTNQVIDQLVEHTATIQPDGSVIDTITLTRAHRGNPLDRWQGVANVSYLRFYVPVGSTLVSATGFTDIPTYRYQAPAEDAVHDPDLEAVEQHSMVDEQTNTRLTAEFGKTVFGNWLSLDPGQTKTVIVSYKLPFKLDLGGFFSKTDTYSLLVQKQPGMANAFLTSRVVLPAGFDVLWRYPEWQRTGNTLQYSADLLNDVYGGVLLKK